MNCSTCKFWEKISEDSGTCFGLPPTIVPLAIIKKDVLSAQIAPLMREVGNGHMVQAQVTELHRPVTKGHEHACSLYQEKS